MSTNPQPSIRTLETKAIQCVQIGEVPADSPITDLLLAVYDTNDRFHTGISWWTSLQNNLEKTIANAHD